MAYIQILIVAASACLVVGQRPFFAGSRPIGYPEIEKPSTASDLGNRFGDGTTTTQRLPLEAMGDRDLVDRISKWPIDKQPFWFINWQALESHRQKPQTYPVQPNPFIETFNDGTINSGLTNVNPVTSNNLGNRSGDTGIKEQTVTTNVATSQTVVPNTPRHQETNVKQSVHSASKDKPVTGKVVKQ